MKKQRYVGQLLLICSVILAGVLGAVVTQESGMVEPLALSGEPVVLQFNSRPAGPPTIEPMTDGRMTFRIMTTGPVTGTLEGTMSATVSEVTTMPSPPLHPVAVMFAIETEQGQIEGYYAGSLYLAEGSDQALLTASGQILSVSGTYADLYLAEVYVNSAVQFVDGRSTGESGTMTITAR